MNSEKERLQGPGRIILSFLLLALLASPSVQAQQGRDESSPAPVTLQIIATTPTRLETPPPTAMHSFSSITLPEIQAQNPMTAPSVLRDLPGIRLKESGSPGESSLVTLRGAEPTQTLILLEGMRLNLPFRGQFDFGNQTLDQIGQIEVLRGGQSALYGSEAMGGVVNLRLARPVRELEFSQNNQFGTYPTFYHGLSLGGRTGGSEYSLGVSRMATEGDFSHDRYRLMSLAGQLRIPAGHSGSISLIHRSQADSKELPVMLIPLSPTSVQAVADPDNELERSFLFNAIQVRNRPAPWLGIWWKAAWIQSGLDWANPADAVNPVSYYEKTDERRLILDLQQDIAAARSVVLTIGSELSWDWVDSHIAQGGMPLPALDVRRRNLAAYLQVLYQREQRLTLQAGVRVDDGSTTQAVVSPKLGMAYRVRKTGTDLRVSAGTGFRSPTIQEQLFPMFGNPGLAPERSVSWETGIRQKLFEDLAWMDLALYWIDYRNLIQKTPTGIMNVGKARTRGIETTLQVQPHTLLKISAHYAYLDARDRVGDEELPFRSRHQAALSVLYAPLVHLSFVLDVNLFSDQPLPAEFNLLDGTVRTDRNPGYGRIDLSANYHVIGIFRGLGELKIFGGARNLLDAGFQDVPGFASPGRELLFGIQLGY